MLSGTELDFSITVENLQLLALACFFISCKYEEIYPPTIKKCVEIADFSYSKQKVVEMEAKVLLHNQFCLTYPTRYTFIEHLLSDADSASSSLVGHNKFKRLQNLSEYLL